MEGTRLQIWTRVVVQENEKEMLSEEPAVVNRGDPVSVNRLFPQISGYAAKRPNQKRQHYVITIL